MEKIGTVCDDFKVEKFKEEFDKAGIKYETRKFTATTTLFTVISEQSIIGPIVDNVTQFFIDKARKRNKL